jgi:Domain of unknown function (DUF4129)
MSVRSIRFYPWRELAILMLVLMEVSWVTPWFRSLTPATYAVSSLQVFISLTCIVLIAQALIRLFDFILLKKSIRRGLMVFFLILTCLIALKTMVYAHEAISLSELLTRPIKSFSDLTSIIPVEFIVILSVLVAYWRGINIAQEHIGPSAVMSHFWLGVVMYILFIFVNTLVTGETPADFFYVFIFSTLVAMSAARMTVVGMVRGGRPNEFRISWFSGIIVASLLVVGLSAFVGSIAGERFNFVGTILLTVIGSFLVLAWLVISPIVSLLIGFLYRLFNQSKAIDLFGDAFKSLNSLISGFGQRLSDLVGNSALGLLISRLAPTLKLILLVTVIILVIAGILVWMTIRLWKDRKRRLEGGLQNENIKTGNLLQMLLGLLRQGWQDAVNSVEQLLDLRHRQRLRAAARIRQIYADLLDLCLDLGHPRQEAQTPLEFEPGLDRVFPELNLEIKMITAAYLRVRYGQLPETHQEVEDIETAWRSLRQRGDELLAELKHRKNK